MENIKLGPGKIYIKSDIDHGPYFYLGHTIGGTVVNKKPNFRQKVKGWLRRAIHNFRR